jgi:hypothetical protein
VPAACRAREPDRCAAVATAVAAALAAPSPPPAAARAVAARAAAAAVAAAAAAATTATAVATAAAHANATARAAVVAARPRCRATLAASVSRHHCRHSPRHRARSGPRRRATAPLPPSWPQLSPPPSLPSSPSSPPSPHRHRRRRSHGHHPRSCCYPRRSPRRRRITSKGARYAPSPCACAYLRASAVRTRHRSLPLAPVTPVNLLLTASLMLSQLPLSRASVSAVFTNYFRCGEVSTADGALYVHPRLCGSRTRPGSLPPARLSLSNAHAHAA